MISSADAQISLPSSEPPATNPGNLPRLRSACMELRAYLDRTRRSIDDEIRSYPTPIPRCDAQFNYLYEQRSRLSQALERVNAALAETGSADALADSIAHFISGASYADHVEETNLKGRLRAELHRLAAESGAPKVAG